MHLSSFIWVIILAVWIVTGLIGLAIEVRKSDANITPLRNLLIIQFISIVILAAASSIENYYSNRTQTQIKDTVNYNYALSKEIKRLQNVNTEIVGNIDSLTRRINTISDQSKDLINIIDSRIAQQFEETAISGMLELPLAPALKDTDLLKIKFGGFTGGNTVYQLRNWKPSPVPIKIGDEIPIKWEIKNNQLVISLTIYDQYGNWIVDIDKNNWRRNPNYTGKFNYDKKGLEIIDNQNNIVLNLNLNSSKFIEMQGYLVIRTYRKIYVAGKTFFRTDMPNSPETQLAFYQQLKNAEITQLFEYTDKNWLHSRKKKIKP